MKKLLKKIIALSLLIATLATLTSCGSKNKKWNVSGLDFSLPENIGKLVSDGYGAFGNKEDETKVYVYYSSSSEVAEEISEGATLKEFAEHYVLKNRIDAEYANYNEKNDTYVLKYTETVDGVERFSYDYFLKSDSVYYHVRMTCKTSLRKDYEKKFDKWKKTFKVSDGLVRYCEVGLNFALPETMKTISVPAEYADICFSNSGDGTQFFIYYYSREALLADLVLNMDCTVKDYADWFVSVNEYNNVDVKYDEENKTLTQKYIYEPENTFYCDYILRDDYSLIHVTMSCDAKIRDIYEPVFEEWIKEISIAEVEE